MFSNSTIVLTCIVQMGSLSEDRICMRYESLGVGDAIGDLLTILIVSTVSSMMTHVIIITYMIILY